MLKSFGGARGNNYRPDPRNVSMSDEQQRNRPSGFRVRLAFGFLFLVGLALMVFGMVGPYAQGPVLAEVIIQRLGLERDPDTYTDIGMILAASQQRRGFACSVVGFSILIAAGYGLYVTSDDQSP
jgi:hypothetical protein